MTLGERLQALRKERGWPRRSVATLVGVTEQTVINWESDRNHPTVYRLQALERVFGVSLKEEK